ncbi:MAG: transposase family protein [Propioniciclava sp.]
MSTTAASQTCSARNARFHQVWPDKTVLFCRPTLPDDQCPDCGSTGRVHDHVVRRFTHLPVGRKTTWLHVTTPRYRCRQQQQGSCTKLPHRPLCAHRSPHRM